MIRATSAALALLSILLTATWAIRRQESVATAHAIRQARAYTVADLTWARVDNWAKDLKRGQCDWSTHQAIPIFGAHTIVCFINGEPFVSLQYSMFTDSIKPADASSEAQLNDMRQWALERGGYP